MRTEGFRLMSQRWAVLPEYLGQADFAARLRAHYDDHAAVLKSLGVQPE